MTNDPTGLVFWRAVTEPVTDYYVPLLMLLVIIDTLLGMAVGIKTGTFEFRRVGDFVATGLLPRVLGWYGWAITCNLAGTGLMGPMLAGSLPPTAALAFGGIVISLAAEISVKVGKLGVNTGEAPPPSSSRHRANRSTRSPLPGEQSHDHTPAAIYLSH